MSSCASCDENSVSTAGASSCTACDAGTVANDDLTKCGKLIKPNKIVICNILNLLISFQLSNYKDILYMICTTPQMNAQRGRTETQTCLLVLVVMRTMSVLQEHLLVLLVMLEL